MKSIANVDARHCKINTLVAALDDGEIIYFCEQESTLKHCYRNDNILTAAKPLPKNFNPEIILKVPHEDILFVKTETGCYHLNSLTFDLETIDAFSNHLNSHYFCSPDGTRILQASLNSVICVSCESWETIAIIDLHAAKTAGEAFVNLGWGKRETQFNGQKLPNAPDVAVAKLEPPKILNLGIHVSWRQDSSYFVVIYHQSETKWKMEVYNPECELMNSGEFVFDLGNVVVDWGRLMIAVAGECMTLTF